MSVLEQNMWHINYNNKKKEKKRKESLLLFLVERVSHCWLMFSLLVFFVDVVAEYFCELVSLAALWAL